MLNSYESYSIDYSDLSAFVLPTKEKPFLLTINYNNVNFEFLIRLKIKNDKAIVFGSGAYDAKSELKPPIFQRHKWIDYFEENLIFYNDPTLYLGQINMGWGFGDPSRHYLVEISRILEKLLKKINITREKTLFYGSSAGGFMSLMLAGLLKNTKALVNNPQTIVWNYYDGHVNKMFGSVYPDLSREEIIEKHPERLNIIQFYKTINYIPAITYLQNVASERDITHHLNPFIVGLSQLEDVNCDINLQLYSDKELGHSPLRRGDTLVNIAKVLQEM